jgi:DNA repair protein RadC
MTYDVVYKEELHEQKVINGPSDVYQLLKMQGYTEKQQEHLLQITIDASQNVIGVHIIHIGTVKSTLISIREIMYNAIMDNAAKMIICHNHPSGSLEPSNSDLKEATRMYKIGILYCIPVMIDMIVSKRGFTIIRPNIAELEKFKEEF